MQVYSCGKLKAVKQPNETDNIADYSYDFIKELKVNTWSPKQYVTEIIYVCTNARLIDMYYRFWREK